MKSRVFYDVLQDNMQQKISSSDKDFLATFRNMIIIDVYMMLKLYREESGSEYLSRWYPEPGSQIFENVLEEFTEQFLDVVFGLDSTLSRAEFITKVANDKAITWIFESEDIRTKWNEICLSNE